MLHVPSFSHYASQIHATLQDSTRLYSLQDAIIREFSPLNPNVIDTNQIIQYYLGVPLYQINAKYGIGLELFILQQFNERK
jgi:hypothetical protein